MPKKAQSSSFYPDNWPTSLPYLSSPIIAPPLPKDILSSARALTPTSCAIEPDVETITSPQTPYPNIHITPITDPNHPAYKQCGLFTTRAHAPGTFICLYLGLVHDTTTLDNNSKEDDDKAQSVSAVSQHSHSDYDLSLDRDLGLAIDAATMGNEARFINDYRGVADRPNAEFRDRKERGVGVFVKRAAKNKAGEEILVSYGRGFWSARRVEESVGEEEEGGVEGGVEESTS
ncbi:hypothetical protein DV738_g4788, partial [Chaetothyriales sp. CBS 135597]